MHIHIHISKLSQHTITGCANLFQNTWQFCVLFANSTFSPWFACNPWCLPWGLICTHRLLLPLKVITLLTLPLSGIRPSKEKAICARSCKDQGMVTKQKCSLLFPPVTAYAVAQSCEKFFAHIAMDVLPRNCFIVRAHCDSFSFSPTQKPLILWTVRTLIFQKTPFNSSPCSTSWSYLLLFYPSSSTSVCPVPLPKTQQCTATLLSYIIYITA